MCGVFGFISDNGEKFKMETLQRIARVTERRGPHAFGFAWIDSRDRIYSFKQSGRISDHLALLAMAQDARMLIGHTRYATAGDPRVNGNNHPHACDGGWLVHNGVVHNYHELVDEHDLHPVTDCDSEAIALLIERASGTRVERCIEAVNATDDSPLVIMGLWARPKKLVVVRRGNPLHISETCRGVYLASLSDCMPGEVRAVADDHAMQFTIDDKGALRGKLRAITEGKSSNVSSNR